MAIKFNCPHCKRPFTVRNQLAGKRATCPGCKKLITVPRLSAAAAAPSPELEAAAMEALADEQQAVEPDTIDFPCPQCDAELHIPRAEAGKRMPCPECGRIIQVPTTEKTRAEDWRKGDQKPSAARRDTEPAPEGVWGSVGASNVSREALEEAKAIPQKKEKLTPQQWAKRGALAGVGLLVLIAGAVWGFSALAKGRETKLLKDALAAVSSGNEAPKLDALRDGEVHRGAGEYYLVKDKKQAAVEAGKHLTIARTLIEKASGFDRDALLIDLALTQVELGGDPADERRLKWERAQTELQTTLKALGSTEARDAAGHVSGARVEGVRAVCHKLIEKGQPMQAFALAREMNSGPPSVELPEATAVAGLELLEAGQREPAQQLAVLALQFYEPPPDASGKPAGPPTLPMAPSLVALWTALGDPGRVEKLKAQPAAANDALQAFLARAAPQEGEIRQALETAVAELRKGNSVAPWALYRLARAATQPELLERLKDLASDIKEPPVQSRVQLEYVHGQLRSGKPPETALADAVQAKTSLAHALALEAIVHAAARNGTSLTGEVDGWEEKERPLGYIGIALGMAERK